MFGDVRLQRIGDVQWDVGKDRSVTVVWVVQFMAVFDLSDANRDGEGPPP
jgi:hypothetical protein